MLSILEPDVPRVFTKDIIFAIVAGSFLPYATPYSSIDNNSLSETSRSIPVDAFRLNQKWFGNHKIV